MSSPSTPLEGEENSLGGTKFDSEKDDEVEASDDTEEESKVEIDEIVEDGMKEGE